ncbi:MAG: acetyl-CoA decarbonylase/synthase complex subunit delta [Dissulfurimicrobium sp.]|uniref:acetyl-CoA decarbonylase/synthase complex subunit delta n=1 Tax=Dissulfurimicrobium sp. TaxID=2022436 RepID=UPI00404935EC
MIAGSNLEHILTSGQFAVTGELGPPKNGDRDVVRRKARILKGHVDAVNITDCQTAIVRMSSLTAGLIALSEGVEPVMQMTCRDRNRIGIQADILGASALGIKNLLCITGDHQRFGNHPQSKGVFDMDSIQLLGMIRGMRDDARFQCGEEIKGVVPRFFLGAAANPFADPFEFRPKRLAKKVAAGANFIQTQIIYNVEKFARFMEMVRDLGLHEKVYILAGITPPKSLGMARYMKNNVPGLDVTDEVLKRLKGVKDQREEGINIAVDIIKQVREIPGVAGCHIMAIEWEEAVPEIVRRAGLGPRPEAMGIEPVLVGQEAVEMAFNKGRDDAVIEMKSELEKVRAEAKALRDLITAEKAKADAELMGLKKELEKAMANQKEAEARAARLELEKTVIAGQAAPIATADASSAMAGIPLSSSGPVDEQLIASLMRSLDLGLGALRKAMGLTEEQFEAIRHFMEAEFMLRTGRTIPVQSVAAPAPVAAGAQSIEPQPPIEPQLVTRLVAKGNVLLHKQDINGAIGAFKEALAINPANQKAMEGLKKAETMVSVSTPPVKVPEAKAAGGMPSRPDEFTEEEWAHKLAIRLVGKGNVLLYKGDINGAKECFKRALELKAGDEKASFGLKMAESGKLPAREAVSSTETAPAQPAPAPPKKEEAAIQPSREAAPKVKPEPVAKPVSMPVSQPQAAASDQSIAFLQKETRSLADRSAGIAQDMFVERLSSSIRQVTIGDGDKALTIGGETALPFHLFEGDMPNPPRVAFEVLDVQPEDWPECLSDYYKDVMNDPVAWARKCVNEYGAKVICLSLVSTDPNGLNRPSADAARAAKSVIDGVDVPVILWGCGNTEKDTETLREVTSLIGSKKVCIAPLTDANYRNLGATAMAFGLPVVASTPIDVNLAKQLNILLENLGVSLNQIMMDPSIGAVGYGLEYTYSVMERIRLAALTQQDDKLQVPFICNLGREVWKAKETRLPTDSLYGDQEKRGVLMEAVTASLLMLAGGDLMVMRHPRAVSLIETLIQGMM